MFVDHMIQRGAVAEDDDDEGPVELLTKPREYNVKFSFPDPPPLNPPIMGAYGTSMASSVINVCVLKVRYVLF